MLMNVNPLDMIYTIIIGKEVNPKTRINERMNPSHNPS